jgi:hypothetical protein
MVLYTIAMAAYSPPATLIMGKAAGQQFDPSDGAYIGFSYLSSAFTLAGSLMTLVLLGAILATWWLPLRRGAIWAWERMREPQPWVLYAIAFGLLAAVPQPAKAFFEKTDRTEAVLIGPNDSAFWIPDVGDNKTSQAQMDSEQYLNERKVVSKRFIIPHQKLSGSGVGWGSWDYYVPTGRLIIVDRSPYSREWVNDETRGSSTKKEGIQCQSKEGLNVTVGISIGVTVRPEDAAKFLYRFGVKKPEGIVRGTNEATDADGKLIFTSVYYGRSLAEVMDDNGRKKIQTLICNQINGRDFDLVNAEAVQIMAAVEKDAKDYLVSMGITQEFIGWGDTFEFDPLVQAAINRAYVAQQDKAIAQALEPYKDTIQVLASAYALRAFGDKADGKLPTTIVGLPADTNNLMQTLFGAGAAVRGHAATPPAPTKQP